MGNLMGLCNDLTENLPNLSTNAFASMQDEAESCIEESFKNEEWLARERAEDAGML